MVFPDIGPSFDDKVDFANADQGLIASLQPCIIKDEDGRIVWNNDEYAFLQDSCPPSANPFLWRQGQLTAKQGLFLVADGIYQVRGFDISNMTLVEGKVGVIVLDTLGSVECATAALDFYRQHRGDRPVKAVIYSHSHYDHFGGAAGVLNDVKGSGDAHPIPIIAPEGFMEEVLKENVVAGPSMRRRAVFMFGESLSKGPKGHVGCGLGIGASKGASSLIPPNDIVKSTGEERTIDGVRIVFQMVPETEAPCEINAFFPDHGALYIAECATHTMHNIVTLRGAMVRDAKQWSKYLDETIDLYGKDLTVLISGHHWPTWECENIVTMLSDQRDVYAYMHDQTVRLMNRGLTGIEIAEQLQLPPRLRQQWYCREYYGALSHNVKGIYQRYMTWFDGNPANLWKHPPKEEAKRYVACFGGLQAVLQLAKGFVERNDLRFAATLLDHVVAVEPENDDGCEQLADVYERLAFGAENAVWRNFYLTAAQRLRDTDGRSGEVQQSTARFSPQSTVEQWLDALSLQLDGPRACELSRAYTITINMPANQTAWTMRLRNGTLTYRSHALDAAPTGQPTTQPDLEIAVNRGELFELLTLGRLDAVRNTTTKGRLETLTTLLDLCGIKSSAVE